MNSFFQLQTALAGRYSLVRELGRGGMGIVYLARDVALDRPVAIKLLPPTLAHDIAVKDRFLREARTVAQLAHPNIVPIHAVEERDGLVFFVMSYVDGETLGARVRRDGPLPVRDAVRVLQEIAWALGHAHARGVVHRDVKPDNVLLDAETGRAIVTDFGIAAGADRETPGSGTTVGTPLYLSPEQARGEVAGPASDLYSLGVTAWFALVGRPPFDGTPLQLLGKHANDIAAPILSQRQGLPVALAHAVDRCLAKHSAERPASAEALASELGSAYAMAPVTPAPLRVYLQRVHGTEVQQYASAGVLSAVCAAAAYWSMDLFTAGIIGTIGAFASAASFVVAGTVLGMRVRYVRELTRAGFDYRAVQRAVAHERAQLATEQSPRTGSSRTAIIGTGGSIIAAGLAYLATLAPSFAPGFALATASAASALLTIRTVGGAVGSRTPGVQGRVMRRLERWMFRVFGVKNAPRAAGDGEATVVALGGAIQDVWSALPASIRAQLPDVSGIAAKLEDEAMRLRTARDDAAAARLQTVVAAMEALRLDLLRLSAGSTDTTAITAHIETARQVGENVDAMVHARNNVDRLLRPPSTPR